MSFVPASIAGFGETNGSQRPGGHLVRRECWRQDGHGPSAEEADSAARHNDREERRAAAESTSAFRVRLETYRAPPDAAVQRNPHSSGLVWQLRTRRELDTCLPYWRMFFRLSSFPPQQDGGTCRRVESCLRSSCAATAITAPPSTAITSHREGGHCRMADPRVLVTTSDQREERHGR
jgi:hypothetical protein